jgi:hypothetical protein
MTDKKHRYPYRVFVCYAHEDDGIAGSVAAALETAGLVVLLDKKLSSGIDYSRQIQDFIQSAHLFVPIITKRALQLPWVNQEIGFAHALNVPVLPIGIGVDPRGLIQNLQAISARDVSNLGQQLEVVDFENIVLAAARARRILVEITANAIDRPLLMVQYAEKVLSESEAWGGGFVRQRAYYTSFSLPDEGIAQPIWRQREHGKPRPADFLRAQRHERQIMEKLAQRHGCRLIIDPHRNLFPGHGGGWKARLTVLRDFIGNRSIDVEVIPIDLQEPHNEVLVGDRFLAGADSRLPGQGYLRTQFTWHAPTVLDRVRRFDEDFTDLCRSAGVTPHDSRGHTLKILDDLLALSEPPEAIPVSN